MYKKFVEGVVSAAVLILKGLKPDTDSLALKSYRHGVMDMLTAILMRPGVTEAAVHEKVKSAFAHVHQEWVHTRLAEERIVEALLA